MGALRSREVLDLVLKKKSANEDKIPEEHVLPKKSIFDRQESATAFEEFLHDNKIQLSSEPRPAEIITQYAQERKPENKTLHTSQERNVMVPKPVPRIAVNPVEKETSMHHETEKILNKRFSFFHFGRTSGSGKSAIKKDFPRKQDNKIENERITNLKEKENFHEKPERDSTDDKNKPASIDAVIKKTGSEKNKTLRARTTEDRKENNTRSQKESKIENMLALERSESSAAHATEEKPALIKFSSIVPRVPAPTEKTMKNKSTELPKQPVLQKNASLETTHADFSYTNEEDVKKVSEITTKIDDLYNLVLTRRTLRIEEASKSLGVAETEIEKWAKILEENKLIEIFYPAFGKIKLLAPVERVKKWEKQQKNTK